MFFFLHQHTQKYVQHIARYVCGSLQLVTTNLNIFVFHCGAMGPNAQKLAHFLGGTDPLFQ